MAIILSCLFFPFHAAKQHRTDWIKCEDGLSALQAGEFIRAINWRSPSGPANAVQTLGRKVCHSVQPIRAVPLGYELRASAGGGQTLPSEDKFPATFLLVRFL